MKNLSSYVLLLTLLLSMPALGLGDLFFTVQQRAVMDVARENGVTEIGEVTEASKVLKVNGLYFKNADKRNKATVWLNGELVNSNKRLHGAQLENVSERDKTVLMRLDKTRSTVSLKAGETLNLDTGELRDSFEK
ncbi:MULTISPECIES: hypothetical protein [Cycloclasticus]|jgi:hypothetical protein|uniref:hypothetical protein n=1 Tax=Cycloclasticus TaxID=34067 RepID=UPI000912D97F|nr:MULTISPECIES: hypothetical protein [Cycloclasticus]PHR50896.1 MAG: hypothetical protein COA48_05455 [Cycloclasticus sp.]SHI63724.1 hypothetical protein SAMN05519226_0689 [Cycloclasticus pugetii]|tara:strand:- start:912 stop:1316 length:405 start_codon:yes stop_codon:yes gene_type:complete